MPTIRPQDDQNTWNIVLSGFFLVVVIVAHWVIWQVRGVYPHSIPLFDALIMALASFRLTRLVVYDKIMRWFRELFVQKKEFLAEGEIWVELEPAERGIRATIHDLLSCPWCVGFWAALIVVFFYYMFDWAWVMILFLAIAGVSSFVQILTNMIGWYAENGKIDARTKQQDIGVPIDLSSLGK